MNQPTLSIIGCGKVGKTLAYLWHQQGIFRIGQIFNRTLASSQRAVDFIQAGNAVEAITDLVPADIFLLGCSDNQLAACANALSNSGLINASTSVFHCSGALSSEVLQPLKSVNASVASIHPIKSFADPKQAITDFAGTYCGMEGDSAALRQLEPAFIALGAVLFALNANTKTLYHTASVMACNYLVALQEVSLQTFAQAGVERELAMQILLPIVRGTVDNIFRLGSAQALTGPIARGDYTIVERQLTALAHWQPAYAALYQQLGQVAYTLSIQQGNASSTDLAQLHSILFPKE